MTTSGRDEWDARFVEELAARVGERIFREVRRHPASHGNPPWGLSEVEVGAIAVATVAAALAGTRRRRRRPAWLRAAVAHLRFRWPRLFPAEARVYSDGR